MDLMRILTTEPLQDMLSDVPIILARAIIMFITALCVMRWTGKRSLSNLAPFDLVLVIIIGEVTAIPIAELELDLLHGLIPVLTIGSLHYLVTKLNTHHKKFEAIVEGRPTLLVKDGQPLKKNMDKEHVSMADLETAMRFVEVKHMGEVHEAWLEHAGGISVVKEIEYQSATPKYLKGMEDRLVDRVGERVEELVEAALRRRLLHPADTAQKRPNSSEQ